MNCFAQCALGLSCHWWAIFSNICRPASIFSFLATDGSCPSESATACHRWGGTSRNRRWVSTSLYGLGAGLSERTLASASTFLCLIRETAALKNLSRCRFLIVRVVGRAEEHTSELQSLMRISYAAF